MRREERRVRDALKAEGPADESDGLIEEWIAETTLIAEQLEEYEREYERIRRNGTDVTSVPTSTRAAIEETVEQTRLQLKEQLEALNELLPNPIETEGRSDRETLSAIIKAVGTSETKSDESKVADAPELERLQEVRRVLTDWTRVVGLTPDFQELIGRSSNVVAATCLFSGNRAADRQEDRLVFDWVIVDEAGRGHRAGSTYTYCQVRAGDLSRRRTTAASHAGRDDQ